MNKIHNNCKLILGYFIEQSQNEIPDSSVDLIFTDLLMAKNIYLYMMN